MGSQARLLLLLLLVGLLHLHGRARSPAPASESGSKDPVELTLVAGAQEKGAVCLDGSPPAYQLQRGFGSGSDNWFVHLQVIGGGWCFTVEDCSERKKIDAGSSKFMIPRPFATAGIFSSDPLQNPDFYNWNKVFVRYCDGASFSGDAEVQDKDGSKIYFRGQRIWKAVIEELKGKGLANATQALLTGCSAGGLAALLHCNDFRAQLPPKVSVKCFADAGFFLDVGGWSMPKPPWWNRPCGQRSFRTFFDKFVHLQNISEVLPKDCLAKNNTTTCFFPAELIKSINTPTFILNSRYDIIMIQLALVPESASPDKSWSACKRNIGDCNSTSLEVLQGFRKQMEGELKVVEEKKDWGAFIDSCPTHCQSDYNTSWSGPNSPKVGNKTVAEAVGDWVLGRTKEVKQINCEPPCTPLCP